MTFAIEKSNKFVAGLSVMRVDSETIGIGDLYVSEESRGQGLGRQIIENAIAQTKKENKKIKKVTLNVFIDQTSAIALYESLGFKIVDTHQTKGTYEGRHLTEYDMELDLRSKKI